MSKIVAIVQARLSSTRLPNKVLADICGRPMIAHVVERVQAMPLDVDVAVMVPTQADYDAIRAVAGCRVLCWPSIPEDDVLARIALGVKGVQRVVRFTADCPLLAPDISASVVASDAPYAWNVTPGYVDGTDTEAVSVELLERAQRMARSQVDREHVTPWIRRHYPVLTIPPKGDYSNHKWSVDTAEELLRVRAIMSRVKGLNFADTLAAASSVGVS